MSPTFGAGNGVDATERDTAVTYATADGTATAGVDYTGTASGRGERQPAGGRRPGHVHDRAHGADHAASVAHREHGARHGRDRWYGVGSNDYTFTAPTSLVIPAGSTTVTVPVTLNDDAVYEADETATLTVALAVTGNPRLAGLVAQIQRPNAAGAWTTVATGPLTSAGTYSTTLRGLTSGASYNFRAVSVASAPKGTLNGASAAKLIRIR